MGISDDAPDPYAPDAHFDVVAIASSAGGLAALKAVLSGLPADFPVAITIVQHLAPSRHSMIAEILGRQTTLEIRQAQEGQRLRAGTAYIAPPDYHLLVHGDGTLSLSHSELVHFVRPSADLLFESIAASYRAGVIAVVLTGSGHDGRMGVQAVKEMGGTVIAQDEESSEFFGMPQTAIETGCVDFILPLERIASALLSLVRTGTLEAEQTEDPNASSLARKET
jgi:two-component system chemotaxis response regulator CheB